jgi:hypothetical protein
MMKEFDQKLTELRVFRFAIVEDVLPPDDIESMREFVVKTEANIGVESCHRGTARHLANLVTLSPMFFQCIDHEKVLPYIESIMGQDLILRSLNAQVVRPGDGKQTLHSDIPLPLHRYGSESTVMMNTIWPLDDFTMENGATCVVPGQSPEPLAGTTCRIRCKVRTAGRGSGRECHYHQRPDLAPRG